MVPTQITTSTLLEGEFQKVEAKEKVPVLITTALPHRVTESMEIVEVVGTEPNWISRAIGTSKDSTQHGQEKTLSDVHMDAAPEGRSSASTTLEAKPTEPSSVVSDGLGNTAAFTNGAEVKEKVEVGEAKPALISEAIEMSTELRQLSQENSHLMCQTDAISQPDEQNIVLINISDADKNCLACVNPEKADGPVGAGEDPGVPSISLVRARDSGLNHTVVPSLRDVALNVSPSNQEKSDGHILGATDSADLSNPETADAICSNLPDPAPCAKIEDKDGCVTENVEPKETRVPEAIPSVAAESCNSDSVHVSSGPQVLAVTVGSTETETQANPAETLPVTICSEDAKPSKTHQNVKEPDGIQNISSTGKENSAEISTPGSKKKSIHGRSESIFTPHESG
eukprot:TRINITY_DN9833_c0_g1_i1.p1 TRINITY_DN9833_c0_g1~~TRINITY_DN9833_c0_g1_i1.p1  ORF type:complete len:447 (+),score=113.02 TRINITY_DN9833_c0_g1_i1:150-1343(+)